MQALKYAGLVIWTAAGCLLWWNAAKPADRPAPVAAPVVAQPFPIGVLFGTEYIVWNGQLYRRFPTPHGPEPR